MIRSGRVVAASLIWVFCLGATEAADVRELFKKAQASTVGHLEQFIGLKRRRPEPMF